MPNIIIIPDRLIEKTCQDAVTFANACQSDFRFYLIPPDNNMNSPLRRTHSEYTDILNYLDSLKKKHNYNPNDFILTFFNGVLSASSHGLTNLYAAGTNYEENPPCSGVISLKYLDWGILEEKYNYEIQKHSILHLIVCGIIGAYTHVEAHTETYGCLMDRNDSLRTFNKKIQKGYYLCSYSEANCYDKINNEKYGQSILQLCENFKESNNFKTLIQNITNMGDTFNNISNSTIINRSHLENVLNKNRDNSDFINALNELKDIVEKSGKKESIEAFDDLNEELSRPEPKSSKLKSFWNALTSSLPSILTMTNIVENIATIIK